MQKCCRLVIYNVVLDSYRYVCSWDSMIWEIVYSALKFDALLLGALLNFI